MYRLYRGFAFYLAHACQIKRGEFLDAGGEARICVFEGSALEVHLFDIGRVGKAPMGGDGVAGPIGAALAGRIVANGDDDVHLRRVRPAKFVP